jgi:hypothetical protein
MEVIIAYFLTALSHHRPGIYSILVDKEMKRGIPFGWTNKTEGGVYAREEVYVE